MEALDQEKVKESRTEKLLRSLNIASADFFDDKLPSRTFSYSQYTAYKICGRAYQFNYVEKCERPNYPPLVRGIAVHAGIEFLLRRKLDGKEATLEEALAVADSRFDESAEGVVSWGADEDGTPTSPELIRTQTHNLLRVFTAEGLARINPVGIEKGFAKKIGDVPMVGWIDLVDEQPAMDVSQMSAEDAINAPKHRVVVDFKTTAKTWSAAQVRNNPQLTLYAHVEGTPSIRVDQLITTKSVKYVRSESIRTPQDIDVLTEDINETAALIKQGVFPKCAVDNWCCNPKHCSWYDKCRGKKKNTP